MSFTWNKPAHLGATVALETLDNMLEQKVTRKQWSLELIKGTVKVKVLKAIFPRIFVSYQGYWSIFSLGFLKEWKTRLSFNEE